MDGVKKEIPNIFYLFLHSKIFYRFGDEANKKEVLSYMFEWRIPQKIRPLIFEEMIILGLCAELDRTTIKIRKPDFNEDKCNTYYQKLGFF